MNRRWAVLSALLATALLLCCMPGLLSRHLGDAGRTDDRLKPAKARTMVVWVTSWLEEDRKLIANLCTAFEKQRPGLRIFLRRTDAGELAVKDAVLPDVVLHVTGDILSPGDGLAPLGAVGAEMQQAYSSGCWQGVQYAVPLWYSPLVCSVPTSWFLKKSQPAEQGALHGGQSYLAPGPPVPEGTESTVTVADLPWGNILETGEIIAENGVGLALLTINVPYSLREEWIRLEAVIRKPVQGEAAVCSLASHLGRGDGVTAFSLPAAAQQVRYASLCRISKDAEAFLLFLMGEEAQKAARDTRLSPIFATGENPQSSGEKGEADGELFLPNAFAMDTSVMDQLCIQGFTAGEDPVATLLKLR